MSSWVIDCIKNDYAESALETEKVAKAREASVKEPLMKQLEPIEKREINELPPDSLFKKYERRHVKRKNS